MHASHNGPVCGGSVFRSPWWWLSASQGSLEGVGVGGGGCINGAGYQPSLNQNAVRRMVKMCSSKHLPCVAGHIFSPFRVKSSAASKLNIQRNRATDTTAIKRGQHVEGKAFYSLTFKRAKIEQNGAGSWAKVWEHLSLSKSSLHDRKAQRWHYTEQDKTAPPLYTISSNFICLFDRCPLLGQLSKHIPKGSHHQDSNTMAI